MVTQLKRSQLTDVARFRELLKGAPRLRWLFFELISRCNLRCRHCGSSCTAQGPELTVADVERTLRSVRGEKPTVCLTGGEPLLHPHFFEIAECVRDEGFFWGMTTNATLIDRDTAKRLRTAGLSTVSVSLDGMERSHDLLRQRRGAWQRALCGIRYLQEAGFRPQVTTVVHRNNLDDLDPLYELLCETGVTSWRMINVEPIGRACESSELLLAPDQFRKVLAHIREKRFDRSCPMEVAFGCSHYLGVQEERMVRDHYFLCGAGILTASVRSNGDICACLDVENRPELVQGNIRTDDFMDVWLHRFEAFRRDRTQECERCAACPERVVCGGDSTHTWDFDRKEPRFCYLDYLQADAT